MNMNEEILKVKQSFKNKYSFLSEEEVDKLYEESQAIYLTLTFPFDKSIVEIPESNVRDLFWIKKCMEEIIERNGCSSAVAYSENGLSYSFDSSTISNGLRNLIKPNIGTYKGK